MMNRRAALALIAAGAASAPLRSRADGPGTASVIDTSAWPPLADRLPKTPRVIDLAAMGRVPGRQGGTIRSLIGGQRDIRLMSINGYARLVGYDAQLSLQPDVLERVEVAGEMSFTFHLREGHRWSDGTLLTSEDFRHGWEDVLNDADVRSAGLPVELIAGGAPPRFTVLDPLTVRYEWDHPNPEFLPALAAPQPLVLLFPAHYMKQFHGRYQTPEALAPLLEEFRVETWPDLYLKLSRTYRPENPSLPSLDPWVNTTTPPAEQFVFLRNPYFHRVDENGVQLPYVDRWFLSVSEASIITAKAGAGEVDLQHFALDFSDYAYLKEAEQHHPVKVALWTVNRGSVVTLLPNLNCNQPVWRDLFRDVRVRRALSLAIDRHEVNMVSFFGLGAEGADTVLPSSPLFRPEYATAWAAHDPDQANALLDEVGLVARDGSGIRLLPNGKPMQIIVESAGESTLETDVLELVTDHWRAIGVALFTRVSQRDIFRSRAMAGDLMMSVWSGLDNAVPTADMSPAGLAPTSDAHLNWPLWGLHHYSRGTDGVAPDWPPAQELMELYEDWRSTTSSADRAAIWHRMLALRADQVLSIGTVNGTLQPLVRSARLRNLPEKSIYGFDPTSYLGVTMPDTFWYDESA